MKTITVKDLLAKTKELFGQMELVQTEDERQCLRNEVIELNIKLVPHILKKYKPYTEDTYQDGCIGLLRAAETYNAKKRVPFANYACLCIEREIQIRFKQRNRKFEGRLQGFLDSLDDVREAKDGEISKYEMIADPNAELDFDAIFAEDGLDELFYDVVIPVLESLKSNSKKFDVHKWKELEIRYMLEMSAEKSQRRRLTFTAMAKELGTSTQNIRTRHARVVEAIKAKCIEKGYNVA